MKTRKAISPVLATVILIAITLIAAIAVTGFIFGLFGTFGGRQETSASAILSADNGFGPKGTITLYNSGTKNIQIAQVTLSYGGQECYASFQQQYGNMANANSQIQLNVFPAGLPSNNGCGTVGTFTVPQSGEAYTGQVMLMDGSALPIAGDFQ